MRELTENCDRRRLAGYLSGQLDLDDRLAFLLHVEDCGRCWETVYHNVKAQHPHFYRQSPRGVKISSKELSRLDAFEEELVEVA